MKSLATALIEHGRIQTTQAKAKTLVSHMSKLVTESKKQTLAARRHLATKLGPKAVKKLIDEIAPKLVDRSGGYMRTHHLGPRRSDSAEMTLIEFIQ